MRKKLLRSVLLITILFSFIACNKNTNNKELLNAKQEITELNNELEFIRNELNELNKNQIENPFSDEKLKDSNYNFCKSEQAIINDRKKYGYNTLTGIAYYQIPIPRGSKLTEIRKTSNSIIYACTGIDYHKDFIIKRKIRAGFSRTPGTKLNIEVIFMFDKDKCSGSNRALTERRKGSVVTGSPFHGK